MSIGMKIAAAAGALALIALIPTPAQAQTEPAFKVGSNLTSYNVSCRAGASTGTAPIRLRVTDDDTAATRWVATWKGSTSSITMTSEDRYFSGGNGATYPCPELQSERGTFEVNVQAYNADVAVGDPITIKIEVRRVGSASGPIARDANGNPIVTTVLGVRLEGDGPAPVGGIRTGAGGTSDRGNNLVVPLGAGLGLAGLAAVVMIRRRRCPAV